MAKATSFSQLALDLKKSLTPVYQKQLPFAATVALTRTAIAVRDGLSKDMPKIFDRPTPYALGAFQAVPASWKSRTFTSKVMLKAFGKTPAVNYLGPEITGGERHLKRSEKLLRNAGILPAGMFLEPGKGAKYDQYGNQSQAEIVQIISALRAFGEVGFTANRAAKAAGRKLGGKRARRQAKFFVAKSKISGDPLGVYKVVGPGKVAPVMIFSRAPRYKPRFDFQSLAQQHAKENFEIEMFKALNESI